MKWTLSKKTMIACV